MILKGYEGSFVALHPNFNLPLVAPESKTPDFLVKVRLDRQPLRESHGIGQLSNLEI